MHMVKHGVFQIFSLNLKVFKVFHIVSRFLPQFLAFFLGSRGKCKLLSNSNWWYVSRISFKYQKSHFVVFHSTRVQRYIFFQDYQSYCQKFDDFSRFSRSPVLFQGFQSFRGFQGCRQPAKRDDQSPESILVFEIHTPLLNSLKSLDGQFGHSNMI